MNIKKAFHLPLNQPELAELKRLTTEIQLNTIMLNSAKQDLTDAIHLRNSIIQDILLNEYNYIISSYDHVLFMDQINEIRIYSPKSKECQEESEPIG